MRMYRIVRELHHHIPYLIQGDTPTPGVWADITRYTNPDHARQFVAELHKTKQPQLRYQPDGTTPHLARPHR